MERNGNKIITRLDAIAAGLNKFFTGKPCKYGHVCAQRTSNWACVECDLRNGMEWAKNNPAKVLEAGRKYGKSEHGKAKKAEWLASPDAATAKSRYNTSDKGRACNRRCYAKNPEKRAESTAKHYVENPEMYLSYSRNRRARVRNAEGSHTKDDISRIRKSQKDRCAYCRVGLKKKGHVDHIQPLSSGGSNWPRNLQLLCGPCNLSKHRRHPIEFAQEKGFLL